MWWVLGFTEDDIEWFRGYLGGFEVNCKIYVNEIWGLFGHYNSLFDVKIGICEWNRTAMASHD